MSLDDRAYELKLNNLMEEMEKLVYDNDLARRKMTPRVFNFQYEINEEQHDLEIDFYAIKMISDSSVSEFVSLVLEQIGEEFAVYNHNMFYDTVDIFVNEYFKMRHSIFLDYFRSKIHSGEEFETIMRYKIMILDRLLEQSAKPFYMCRKPCSDCNLKCVLESGHDIEM